MTATEILQLDFEDADIAIAGLAGGLGLSGNVCAALASTIVAILLKYFRDRNRPKHSMETVKG
ncbi:MAG: hypothetical protein E4H20_05285 [Spirochaetales bacterium]|nr:MAG: hypothetical protein E4H20_05285 [Spirochaetales bacterium]